MKAANPAAGKDHNSEIHHDVSKPGDKNHKAVERLLVREKKNLIDDRPIFKVKKHDPF